VDTAGQLIASLRDERAQHDPRQDGSGPGQLPPACRLAEGQPADRGADERLEVEERAGELGGDPALPEREQPERQERPDHAQRGERGDRLQAGRRGRRAPGQERDRQGEQPAGAELHRGHGSRIAAPEQAGLDDDHRSRQRRGGEHEQVAVHARATAVPRPGDECDAEQRDGVATPAHGAHAGPPDAGGDQRDEDRDGADNDRGLAHAGARDAGVLEHDHGAEPEGAAGRYAEVERLPQAAAPSQRHQRRRDGEPRDRQPRRRQPPERELGERHGQAPQHAGCGQGDDRDTVLVLDKRHVVRTSRRHQSA